MTHSFHVLKGSKPQRGFKIGVAIPCFHGDIAFLTTCLSAIERLNPQPFVTVVDVNRNSNIDEARSKLFEYLFYAEGCDVVLQNSVDFYVFKNILKYVKRNRVVSFNLLCLRRYDLSFALYHLLFPSMGWTGCYSMPIEYWEKLKHAFDGFDSSVWLQLGRFNYDFHKRYSYYSLRPYRKESMEQFLKTKSLWKRVFWRWFRMGIG